MRPTDIVRAVRVKLEDAGDIVKALLIRIIRSRLHHSLRAPGGTNPFYTHSIRHEPPRDRGLDSPALALSSASPALRKRFVFPRPGWPASGGIRGCGACAPPSPTHPDARPPIDVGALKRKPSVSTDRCAATQYLSILERSFRIGAQFPASRSRPTALRGLVHMPAVALADA